MGPACCQQSILLGIESRNRIHEYLGCLFNLGSHWCSGLKVVFDVFESAWLQWWYGLIQIHLEVWGCSRAALLNLDHCVSVTFMRDVPPKQGWDMSLV